MAAHPDPFAQLPKFVFQLSYNNMRMAWGLSCLWREIENEIARKSARESRDGRVKVYRHGHHRILQTPDYGLFIVLLRPPPEDGGRDVPLLFAFRDLYLCGFHHEDGLWHVFSDANLGAGIDINNHPSVHNMGFPGGYSGRVHQEVHIAADDLYQTYLILVQAGSPRGICNALYRIMVTVCEALRLIEWRRELLTIYMEGRVNPVVDRPGDVTFSPALNLWSHRSRAVEDGEEAFEAPKFGFTSYDALLRHSGVILSRNNAAQQR